VPFFFLNLTSISLSSATIFCSFTKHECINETSQTMHYKNLILVFSFRKLFKIIRYCFSKSNYVNFQTIFFIRESLLTSELEYFPIFKQILDQIWSWPSQHSFDSLYILLLDLKKITLSCSICRNLNHLKTYQLWLCPQKMCHQGSTGEAVEPYNLNSTPTLLKISNSNNI